MDSHAVVTDLDDQVVIFGTRGDGDVSRAGGIRVHDDVGGALGDGQRYRRARALIQLEVGVGEAEHRGPKVRDMIGGCRDSLVNPAVAKTAFPSWVPAPSRPHDPLRVGHYVPRFHGVAHRRRVSLVEPLEGDAAYSRTAWCDECGDGP
jgi:hypothetical protein